MYKGHAEPCSTGFHQDVRVRVYVIRAGRCLSPIVVCAYYLVHLCIRSLRFDWSAHKGHKQASSHHISRVGVVRHRKFGHISDTPSYDDYIFNQSQHRRRKAYIISTYRQLIHALPRRSELDEDSESIGDFGHPKLVLYQFDTMSLAAAVVQMMWYEFGGPSC